MKYFEVVTSLESPQMTIFFKLCFHDLFLDFRFFERSLNHTHMITQSLFIHPSSPIEVYE